MGLSLKNIGKKLWEAVTPQDEGAQRRADAALAASNQAVQQPARYGVLANPQATQQFTQSQQAPVNVPFRFNIGTGIRGVGNLGKGVITGTGLPWLINQDIINPVKETSAILTGNKQAQLNASKFYRQPVGQQLEQLGGNIAAAGLTVAAPGITKGIESSVGKVIAPKLAREVVAGGLSGAAVGAPFNVASLAQQGAPLTKQNVVKTAAQGAAIGGGLGVAAPVVTAGVRAAPKLPAVVAAADKKVFTPRVNLEEQAILHDYSDALVGANPAQGSELSNLITKARAVGDKYGIDLTNGSVADRLNRANSVLDQIGAREKTQIGAVGKDVTLPEKPIVTAKGLEARGFERNIAKSNLEKGDLTAQAVVEAMPGYKPISNRQTLGKAAAEINKDAQTAYARVITKPQLTSAHDVATGNLLLRQAVESGDIEAAIQVGTKLGIDGTKLGQAIQAYSLWSKTTPEGIVKYASKQAQLAGKELDPGITKELVTAAKNIADMPEGLQKAKATQELLNQAESINRNWKDTAQQIISSPRSAMATADLSAPLRQGVILGSRYPKQFASSFKDMFKYFTSPGAYEQAMYDISQRPTYALMKSHKLAVGGATGITGTEEQFMSSILEGKVAKKLGVGHLVAASDRAYTGFLTKLRADVFDKVVKESANAGVKLDKPALDSLTKFINSASGRGSGKNLDRYGGILSQALFSPRLWKSRIDTLNPAYYARLDPMARKLALQSAASFLAVTGTVLGLAKAAGAEVGMDPRSADFAKIKVGNTRYDILGGLQQNARLAAQLISGQKINSETGEVQTLGPDRGFGKPSRLDLAYQFVENKENPVVGLATKLLRGTDPAGNKINPVTETGKLGVPLVLQGVYDTAKDLNSLPKGAAMNVPGVFGIGVQTYGASKTSDNGKVSAAGNITTPQKPQAKGDAKAELSALKNSAGEGYSLQQLSGGKYAYNLNGDVKTSGTLKEAQKAIVKDSFAKSDTKSKVLGDTYWYKDKEGNVHSEPKIRHDYDVAVSQFDLELDRAYRANDTNKWLDTAQKKVDALEQKKALYDPETEQDEITKITNQQEDIKYKAEKYLGYGGFTKPKKASKNINPSAGSVYKYAITSRGAGSARPRVSVKGGGLKSVKVASKGGSRPTVSLKKSLV